MNAHRSWRVGRVAAAAMTLAGTALGCAAGESADRGPAPIRYQPADSVPRPELAYSAVEGVLMVRDFDGDSSRLYLLDPIGSQVHIISREPSGWARTGSFGRRGGGPGEFVSPTGIAVLRSAPRVAVADAGRIHFFDAAGAYQESVAPGGLCPMPQPRLAAAPQGLFMHGICADGDSVFDVLYWSADGTAFSMVARDFRSTGADQGAVYAASNPFGEGAGSALFGAGVTGCVLDISYGAPPAGERRCLDGFRPYRFEFRPETLERMEARRAKSKALAGVPFPERHPAFVHALVLARGPALLRSWAEDSVVVRYVDAEQDLAVLPLSALVGCRLAGCLWGDLDPDGTRVAFLSAARLDRLDARTR